MKNAPTTNSNESAPDKANYTVGRFPKRINTVTASVLACLISGLPLTGLDAVYGQSTTRLAAVIHSLIKLHGWAIESTDMVAGTNDGRIAYISSYWLPRGVIAAAYKKGASEWLGRVHTARKARKKLADGCKVTAAYRNSIMKADPRQVDFWGCK